MKREIELLIEQSKKQLIQYGYNSTDVIHKAAPASLIIMGDHTHYNEGIILSTAIDRHTVVSLSKTEETGCIIFHGEKFIIDEELDIACMKNFNWVITQISALYSSLEEEIEKKLIFNCSVATNIPKSIGLGSAASVSISFLKCINELYSLQLDEKSIIKIAFRAEKKVYGDIANKANLFTSLNASKNGILLIDLRTEQHEVIKLNTKNYKILICDTNIFIDNQTDICNERIEECDVGVKGLRLYIWGIKNLRDVQIDFLERHIKMLPMRIYNRCLYNVKERNRVTKALSYLQNGRVKQFGDLLYQSHEGLSEEYEIGSPELNLLINFSKSLKTIIGSKLISCSSIKSTLNIIRKANAEDIEDQFKTEFQKNHKTEIKFHSVNFSDGFYLLND